MNHDPHTLRAARKFGVPPAAVTPAQRQAAKSETYWRRYHGPAIQNLPPSTTEACRLVSAWHQQYMAAEIAWRAFIEEEALVQQCARMFGWLVESCWDEVIYMDVNSDARRSTT